MYSKFLVNWDLKIFGNLIQKRLPVIPDNQLARVIESKTELGLVAETPVGDEGGQALQNIKIKFAPILINFYLHTFLMILSK